MLILTRKPGESVYIGDTVKITIVETKGNQVRVGIDAPKDLRIYREEIYLQILEENKKAAAAALVPDAGLEGLSKAWSNKPVASSLKKLSQPTSPSSSGGVNKLGPDLVVRRKKDSKDPEE